MLIDLGPDDLAFIRALLIAPVSEDPTPGELAAHEHGVALAARIAKQRDAGGSPYYADMRAWTRENDFRQAIARMPYGHQLATLRMHPLDPIAVLGELGDVLAHEVAQAVEADAELRQLQGERAAVRSFFGTAQPDRRS